MKPAVGSRWRGNFPGSEQVIVESIEGDRAVVRRLGASFTVKVALKNFNVKHSRGYTAVKEEDARSKGT